VGLKLVSPPSIEPVTLAEAKAHLRLDTDADDAYVSALIIAARERAELFLRRALITQTFEYTMDRFPVDTCMVYTTSFIDLPRPPLRSVEWIRYIDTADNQQTLRPETYVVDASSNEMGRVGLAGNQFWPITRRSINAVVIRFVAGYGDEAENVPQAIRHGILIEISNLYENREDVVIGQAVNMLPVSERLLWPYRALTAH
jgi:uncharacterized phiE125 gp8 family phage protein